MNWEQIIQVGGIAICLWEIAKIFLSKSYANDDDDAAYNQGWVDGYRYRQSVTMPKKKKNPPTIATKEEFLDYLKNWWDDTEFTISDVCPENWTNQKTAAVIHNLYARKKLVRSEKDGKLWYKITY